MSRSADGHHRDAGFTLVEIMVALGILMIVVIAVLPQLVVGIRATVVSRTVSQAKGVAEGQLDRMRNLPYHVAPAAGDYRDVLDFYFRNLATGATPTCTSAAGKYLAPQVSWAGYVAPAAARCAYEPAGALYRSVYSVPAATGSTDFMVVVDTQFLSAVTPPQPLTPPTGYNSQTTGKDTPVSSQIGITVTALYTNLGVVHPISTYTQVSDQPTTATRIRAEAGVTTLDVGSVTAPNGPVSFSAGLLSLSGSLTFASTVDGTLSGVSAGLATGEQASGATTTISAPPAQAATTKTRGAGSLSPGCVLACWGSTRLDLPAVSSDQGLPNAGTPTAPMQSLVTDTGNAGLSFGNSATNDYRPGLQLSPPLVRLDSGAVAAASGTTASCTSSGTGTSSYVTASGYLRTAGDASPAVEACAVARASSVSLFPTTFAPRGVVLLELRRASTRCLVSGAAHTSSAAYDYEAVVRYFDGTSYQTAATVTPSGTDPLASLDLATTSVGGGKVLGDYIDSWSSLTQARVVKTQSPGLAEVKLPGVVTIASQPVRVSATDVAGDPASVVSVTLGALSCAAQDAR